MILEIDGWRFDIDFEATKQYSENEAADHCECGYCRNYYGAVDGSYPVLRPFLGQFGVNIEGPDELIPFEPNLYRVSYAVKGVILEDGCKPICANGLSVLPEAGQRVQADAKPYFWLTVDRISVPWVLDEPMEEVLSPANEPSFIKRIIDRLLNR